MDETTSKSSITSRLIAVVILGVAAWVLLKIVIGVVVAVAWTVAAIVAVIAVFWALRTLTRD
jgi:hypothetical protein